MHKTFLFVFISMALSLNSFLHAAASADSAQNSETTYTLSITTANGTVTKSPNKTTYASGESVTLTATPNVGYIFSSWTADVAGTTNPVTITMNGNKTVTTNFTQLNSEAPCTLSITTENGTVTKSPNKTTYTPGETVTLTATPNTGFGFDNWTGDITGATNPVTITLQGKKSVTANFTLSFMAGMTAHWMLDDNTGQSPEDSVAGHIATLVNDPSWGYAWANEDWVCLTNQTQAIAIPADVLQPQAGSIALWIEPDNLVGTQFILGHIVNSSNRINLYSVAGKLALGLGSIAALKTNIADLTIDQPVHIVLTWNGTSYAVYVDRIQKASGTFDGLNALNTTMDVGNYGNPANRTVGFVGVIEDIRTYSRALSASEIEGLYYTYDVYQQKSLNFQIQALDANGLPVSYQPASKLPSGSKFESGTFSWQPWYDQKGTYRIRFTAAGQPDRIITIFVHDAPITDWYKQFLINTGK
jgi:hypothetical protein